MSQSKNTTHVFGSIEIMSHQHLNNSRISGLGEPISPSDATTKNYVDSSIVGSNLVSGVGITVNTTTNTININNNQSTITTLGTIQNGIWNASTIQIAYGGTGVTNFAPSRFIYYNGSNQLVSLDEFKISPNNTNINLTIPLIISNTTDTINSLSSIGSLIVEGGVNIYKQLYVGGNVKINGNITVGNITINGNITLTSLNAVNAQFINISTSSLNSSTINLIGHIVTPLTSTSNLISNFSSMSNIMTSNTTITNSVITSLTAGNLNIIGLSILSSINSSNISSGSIFFNNGTANNLTSTNFSSATLRISNTGTLLNCIISSSTINNLNVPVTLISNNTTITTLSNTNANILNLINNNLLSLNSTITNCLLTNISTNNLHVTNTVNSNVISSSNSYISNTLYTANLSNINTNSINNTITNTLTTFASIGSLNVSGNANLSNVNLTNLTGNSLFINNFLTSTYSTFVGTTCSNLNVNGIAIFSTSNSVNMSTGILNSGISISNNSSIGTLNVSGNINNSRGTILTTNISSTNLYSSNLLQSLNITNTNLSTINISTSNINSVNSSIGTLNNTNQVTVNLNNTNQTTTNIINNNLINTNISSGNIKVASASIGNSYIVNNSVSNSLIINSSITNATLNNLIVNTNAIFNKNLSLMSSYQGPITNTAGSFFNIFSSTFTNNVTISSGMVNSWYANYIASATLVASNNLITTNKTTNLYIQSNVVLGANQTINYNSGLLMGYVTNTTGGNLNTQISFERADGNAFAGIYTENSTNKLVIINSSLTGGSGLGIYTIKDTPVVYSNIPSSTNITPTPYIQLLNTTSNFYSTIDSNSSTSGSVVLAGGLGVTKHITTTGLISNNISSGNLNVDGNLTLNNGYFTNTGYLLDTLSISSYPQGTHDLVFNSVPNLNSRITVSPLGITFQDPGVYQLQLKLHSNTITSISTLLQIHLNIFTNNIWVISQSASLDTIFNLNTDFNSVFMLYINSAQEVKFTLDNNHTGNFDFDNSMIWSRVMINKIG